MPCLAPNNKKCWCVIGALHSKRKTTSCLHTVNLLEESFPISASLAPNIRSDPASTFRVEVLLKNFPPKKVKAFFGWTNTCAVDT